MNISSYSFYTTVGGYGLFNLGWSKYLARLKDSVFIHPQYAPKPGSREWEILNEEEKNLFTPLFEKHRIGISGTTPWEFKSNESEVRVAMTMAESDQIGEDWVKACNTMSYIAVPNDFFRDVFKNSGVTVPIKVIRAGIDTEKYPYYERPERDVFTFGICGYLNERKGAFELIQAFASEFSPDEPVRLKLHTTNHAFRYYKNFSDPRIELSWDYKDFSQLNEFYRSLDCFVFPSKAEGVGYPPREAMSTGLPTIVTEYSGLYDIARAGWAYPLSNLIFQKRKDMTDQPGNWAVIDTSELMYWMRHVYEHRNEAKRKGKTASEYIHKYHSWEYCAKKLKEFLEVI